MAVQVPDKSIRGSDMMEFTLKLYKAVEAGDKNVFLSPFSISSALLLANLGAKGATEQEIRHALGFEGLAQDEVHSQFKELQTSLNAETNQTTCLVTANRIYSRIGVIVDPEYVKDSAKYHGGGLELLDFIGDSEGSRNKINKWVEEQTRDKIKNLLPSGVIDADTVMVLVNAIYFKGIWLEQFESERTTDADFHVSTNNTVKIRMMKDKQEVRFLRDNELRCSAVQLPYQDGNVKMVFIRPNEVDGLKTLEESLTANKFNGLLNNLGKSSKPDVNLGIPKFKMEAQYSLVDTLKCLGIKAMFEKSTADFTKMLPDSRKVYVSAVVHKAYLEVNEKGTEAAAATGMVFMLESCRIGPVKDFILDRPFIFVILDKNSGTVLFMGRYTQPPTE